MKMEVDYMIQVCNDFHHNHSIANLLYIIWGVWFNFHHIWGSKPRSNKELNFIVNAVDWCPSDSSQSSNENKLICHEETVHQLMPAEKEL